MLLAPRRFVYFNRRLPGNQVVSVHRAEVRQPAEWLVEEIEGWDERLAYLGSDTLFSHRRPGRLHFLPRHRSSSAYFVTCPES